MTIKEVSKSYKYLNRAVAQFIEARESVKGSFDTIEEYLAAADAFKNACKRMEEARVMLMMEDGPETITNMVLMGGSEEKFLSVMFGGGSHE